MVPRFLAALQAAGASHVRVPAYSTTPGCGPAECDAEAGMLRRGELHAIAFSSPAEVGRCLPLPQIFPELLGCTHGMS